MKTSTERVKFQLLEMPCCHLLVCWVNPRLPNYCPECGQRTYRLLKSGEWTRTLDENAVLKVKYD